MDTNITPQPFLTQAPAHPCADDCTQGTQIVPVPGNNDRATPVYVVYHGREYLTHDALVTRTPVHMAITQATSAHIAHAAIPYRCQGYASCGTVEEGQEVHASRCQDWNVTNGFQPVRPGTFSNTLD